jgi:hypothetical protein
MIAVGIVTAEIAFWVVLAAALLTRYVAGLRRTSTVLLLGLPVVDLALLALVAVDLGRGAEPETTHALAACYLGFTVAFGHRVVAWADARVAHRLRGTPLPAKPARGSAEHVRGLWEEWFRVVVAVVVAGVVLALLGVVSGRGALPPSLDATQGNPLWGQMVGLLVLAGIWFLAGPAFAGRRDTETSPADRDGR